MAGYQNIFIAITLIVAMFMGCTFNAVNIISEKEDGIALINEILPISSKEYIAQKIFILALCLGLYLLFSQRYFVLDCPLWRCQLC